jgi:uncharacterized membrane protein
MRSMRFFVRGTAAIVPNIGGLVVLAIPAAQFYAFFTQNCAAGIGFFIRYKLVLFHRRSGAPRLVFYLWPIAAVLPAHSARRGERNPKAFNMDFAYFLDWLNFLGRWLHLIVGIAWIGASFYFVWLDTNLKPPKDTPSQEIGIGGEVWAVHGGGFYRAQKFKTAPQVLPEPLHWFKWESYATWLSGFFLLCLMYYGQAEIYLIDKSILDLSKGAAIGIGLGALLAGWVVYDLLCRSPLGNNEPLLAALMFCLLALAAYGLTHVFSGRGAFIHFGAMLGTIMSANVLMVIIPGQRKMVEAKKNAQPLDPIHGLRGKQRSVHNTYFTLPVLFVMISNHYAFLTNAKHAWIVLIGLSLAGCLIRLYFVRKHQGHKHYSWWAGGIAIIAALYFFLAPTKSAIPAAQISKVSYQNVAGIIETKCATCHMAKPTYAGFAAPPKNILLDTPARVAQHAQAIYQQTVVLKAMPIGNLTNITEDERAKIAAWFQAGAPTQ